MQQSRLLPPTYFLIALVAMAVLHFLVPVAQVVPAPWNLVGIFPLVVGIALNVVADGLFHKVKTTIRPGAESAVLVTGGPFTFSRNPMYLGFALVLLGVALLLGSLTPFAVIPVFAVLIDRMFIEMEEQMLRTKFGAAWETYASRTRRWL